mmetsp:Transcript_1880/g.5705  ORF Transcript_1880/g.5705 Transcript_1880/m.5705 type:complete len:241 (-) Transcript_1880:52-774(-)
MMRWPSIVGTREALAWLALACVLLYRRTTSPPPCPYVWNGGAPDDMPAGSCWVGARDKYALCTPSLAVDLIIENGASGIILVRRRDSSLYAVMGGRARSPRRASSPGPQVSSTSAKVCATRFAGSSSRRRDSSSSASPRCSASTTTRTAITADTPSQWPSSRTRKATPKPAATSRRSRSSPSRDCPPSSWPSTTARSSTTISPGVPRAIVGRSSRASPPPAATTASQRSSSGTRADQHTD